MYHWIVLVGLFACVTGQTQNVNVTIYTKDFSPFSVDGEGFSIDFAKEVLYRTFGRSKVTTTVPVLDSNAQMFTAVRQFNNTPDSFAMSTSAISITAEREALGDFLSFYTSGYLVLIHDRSSSAENTRRLIVGFLNMILLFVAFIASAGFFFAIFSWVLEFSKCPDGEYPGFLSWTRRDDPFPVVMWGKEMLSKRSVLMLTEFGIAWYWACLTMCSTDTGIPKAKFVTYIRKWLQGLSKVLLLLALSISSYNSFKSANSNSSINGFDDLNGHTLCTVSGTTPETYVDTNNVGYRVTRRANIDGMFRTFEADDCEAIVYDGPILMDALSSGRVQGRIVGDLFNTEEYGIFISDDNPYEEELRRSVIELKMDTRTYEGLIARWFRPFDRTSHTSSSNIIRDVWLIGASVIIVLFFFATRFMKNKYAEKELVHTEAFKNKFDRKYDDNYQHLWKQMNNPDSITTDASDRNYQMYHMMRMSYRLVLEQRLLSEGYNLNQLVAEAKN